MDLKLYREIKARIVKNRDNEMKALEVLWNGYETDQRGSINIASICKVEQRGGLGFLRLGRSDSSVQEQIGSQRKVESIDKKTKKNRGFKMMKMISKETAKLIIDKGGPAHDFKAHEGKAYSQTGEVKGCFRCRLLRKATQ